MHCVYSRYAERLAETESDMSIGSVGDGYDNSMAETVIGLFKTEVVKHLGPWKTNGQLKWETMKWVHWYNKDRLHGVIGYQTPYERRTHSISKTTSLERQSKC